MSRMTSTQEPGMDETEQTDVEEPHAVIRLERVVAIWAGRETAAAYARLLSAPPAHIVPLHTLEQADPPGRNGSSSTGTTPESNGSP